MTSEDQTGASTLNSAIAMDARLVSEKRSDVSDQVRQSGEGKNASKLTRKTR